MMASRHKYELLNNLISLRLQDDYTIRDGREGNYEPSLLNIYQELEVILEEDTILPESFDLDRNEVSIFREWLQLGLILFQSRCLSYSYSHKTLWKTEFKTIPTEVYLSTSIGFHLSKHTHYGESVNILISQLKFERFLVAFLLKDSSSMRIAFLAYRQGNFIETDNIFQKQMLKCLDKYRHTEWSELSNILNRRLSHLKETRNRLLVHIIKNFSLQNDQAISQVILHFYDTTESTPHSIPRVFYDSCVEACVNPLSNIHSATHPDTVLNRLHSILDSSNLDNEEKCLASKNFGFSKILSPNISTDEANKIISKYAPTDDELNDSFSPEFDQDVTIQGFIDVLLQLTSRHDNVISILKLICSRKYPMKYF